MYIRISFSILLLQPTYIVIVWVQLDSTLVHHLFFIHYVNTCVAIIFLRPFRFKGIINMLWLGSANLLLLFVSSGSVPVYLCLPSFGLLERFLGFLYYCIFCISLCIVYLVVALGNTICIHNFSQSTGFALLLLLVKYRYFTSISVTLLLTLWKYNYLYYFLHTY